MWFLVIGLIAVVLKLAEVSPVADWSWWVVGSPFAATALWWMFADSTGLTAKREQKRWMQRRDKRRQDNIDKLRTHKAGEGKRVQRHDPTGGDGR